MVDLFNVLFCKYTSMYLLVQVMMKESVLKEKTLIFHSAEMIPLQAVPFLDSMFQQLQFFLSSWISFPQLEAHS